MVHYRGGAAAIDPEVYADTEEFWADLTAAYRQQVARVHELGCTYLQLDDTSLAYLNDPEQRRAMADRGEDSEHLHEAYIRHLNEALDGRPDGLTVTTHMCRGNFRDSWVAEGGYDFVAEALFTQLGVDGFFLEYDDERSGGFEPLRHVPKDKLVVLGLVTTKHGELESKDALKARLDEASAYVDLDQVCISPQCGFSSTSEGNSLSVDQEKAKLRCSSSSPTRSGADLRTAAPPPRAVAFGVGLLLVEPRVGQEVLADDARLLLLRPVGLGRHPALGGVPERVDGVHDLARHQAGETGVRRVGVRPGRRRRLGAVQLLGQLVELAGVHASGQPVGEVDLAPPVRRRAPHRRRTRPRSSGGRPRTPSRRRGPSRARASPRGGGPSAGSRGRRARRPAAASWPPGAGSRRRR